MVSVFLRWLRTIWVRAGRYHAAHVDGRVARTAVVNGGGKVGPVGSLIVGLRLQVRPAAALKQQDPSRTGSVPLT